MMDGIKIMLCPMMVNAVYVEHKAKRFIASVAVSMMKDFVRSVIKILKIEADALYAKSVCETLCKYLFFSKLLWKAPQMSNV